MRLTPCALSFPPPPQLQGFRSAAQREIDALEKASVPRAILIRVALPDRTVLEASFGPLEPAAALYGWVRHACLAAPPPAFRLFTTPPPAPIAEAEPRALFDLWRGAALRVHLAWEAGGDAPPPPLGAPPSAYLAAAALAGAAASRDAAPAVIPASLRVVEPALSDEAVDAAAAALLGGGGGGGVSGAGGGAPARPRGAVPAAFAGLFKRK